MPPKGQRWLEPPTQKLDLRAASATRAIKAVQPNTLGRGPEAILPEGLHPYGTMTTGFCPRSTYSNSHNTWDAGHRRVYSYGERPTNPAMARM